MTMAMAMAMAMDMALAMAMAMAMARQIFNMIHSCARLSKNLTRLNRT